MKKMFFIVFSSLLLMSCSGGIKKEEARTLKPKQLELKGDLKNYFEVLDKDHMINPNKYLGKYEFMVELKCTDDNFPFDPDKTNPFGVNGIDEYAEDHHVGFGIEILDENDNIVYTRQATGDGFDGPYSIKDVEGLIHLNKDDTGTIRWGIGEDVVEKGKTFRISSAVKARKGAKTLSKSVKTGDSSKWDKILDNYEQYVDQYAKLYKKAQQGDVSALSEYASMLDKANKLATQLEGANSDLNSKQMARFAKIQAKLMSAL